jgi:hypothetical protein
MELVAPRYGGMPQQDSEGVGRRDFHSFEKDRMHVGFWGYAAAADLKMRKDKENPSRQEG